MEPITWPKDEAKTLLDSTIFPEEFHDRCEVVETTERPVRDCPENAVLVSKGLDASGRVIFHRMRVAMRRGSASTAPETVKPIWAVGINTEQIVKEAIREGVAVSRYDFESRAEQQAHDRQFSCWFFGGEERFPGK